MRINHLDGFRGLAILLVVFFHAYTGWPALYPYGDTYADFPLFKLGWLGVQLFFLLSGFVIFMTLDRTANFKSYLYKRWLRLFPAMLIASVLIYLTATFFHERPDGIPPSIVSLLPGLTFTQPSWWSKLLGFEVAPIEGAFWSLYVEFKFYIIAGLAYYALGRKYLVPVLVALYTFWILIFGLSMVVESPVLNALKNICNMLSVEYFGWFAAGAMTYIYSQTEDNRWFNGALALMVISTLTVRMNVLTFDADVITGALIISGLFATSFKSSGLRRVLENRILLFIGFISYPFYLIHEDAMVSMTIKMASLAPWLHPFLYPLPAIILLMAVAYIITRHLEPALRHWIGQSHLKMPLRTS